MSDRCEYPKTVTATDSFFFYCLLACSLLILKRIHHFVSDETFVTALLNTPYLVTIHRVKKSIPLLTSAEEIQPHIPVIFFLTAILLWVIILLVCYFLPKSTCIVYVAYLLFIIFTLYRDIFKWQLSRICYFFSSCVVWYVEAWQSL